MADRVVHGTSAFRRMTVAMVFGGFSTFSVLYSTQALLPVFAREFGLSAEAASLAVSLATGPLAVTILFAGILSDRIGRRGMMVAAMYAAGALTLAIAAAPNWPAILAMRFLSGIALAGVPAVAMAYVSEEVEARSVGSAMGLYIAGSAIGGMTGRLGISLVTDFAGWRWAVAANGLVGILLAEGFRQLAPASRHFTPQRDPLADLLASAARLFRDAAMPLLYAEAFLLMGTFVTLYNYMAFRLLGPPFGLSHSAVGAVFLLYILGSVSSERFGKWAGVAGRRKVLWIPIVALLSGVLLTLPQSLALTITGMAVATIGFFGAHSIGSSWVGRRALASRGQAAALYLFFYYLGSSILGSAGGMAWTRWGWPGVALFCAITAALALAIAARLAYIPPLGVPEVTPPKPLGTD